MLTVILEKVVGNHIPVSVDLMSSSLITENSLDNIHCQMGELVDSRFASRPFFHAFRVVLLDDPKYFSWLAIIIFKKLGDSH